jgi:hypothetical protein
MLEVAVTHPLAATRSRAEMREPGSFVGIVRLVLNIIYLLVYLSRKIVYGRRRSRYCGLLGPNWRRGEV